MSEEFVVVAATRTPIGNLPGRLVAVPAFCLTAASITGALERGGRGCAWAAIGIGGEVTAVVVETLA
jgi:hypothetical protein